MWIKDLSNDNKVLKEFYRREQARLKTCMVIIKNTQRLRLKLLGRIENSPAYWRIEIRAVGVGNLDFIPNTHTNKHIYMN